MDGIHSFDKEIMDHACMIFRMQIYCAASFPVIALDRIGTHRHRTRMLIMKRSRLALRQISPAFRFGKPFPTALCIYRGAMAVQ